MAADGSIIIDTSINDDGFVAGTKELEAACKRTAVSIEGISEKQRIAIEKTVNAFAKQNAAYAQQEAKVVKLKSQMKELSGTQVETSAYKAINQEIDSLASKIARAEAKKREMLATGGSDASRSFQKLEYQTEQLTEQLERAIGKRKELESSGGAYRAADVTKIAEQLSAAESKLSQMQTSLNTSYRGLKQKFSDAAGGSSKLSSAASTAANAVKKLGSKLGGILKKGLSSVGSLAKKAATGLLSIGKGSKSANSGLASSVKTMLKYAIGARTLFSVISKLKSALIDGMKNLVQYSDSANSSISNMRSSISTLKNSVAAAFAPVLNIAAPVVTSLINMLSTAISYIGAFFAALSGQKTYTRAIAVQEDYAASLKDTASAAGSASKETKDYLSGLDEIRKFDDGSGAGAGGVGGAGAVSGPMFEEAEIPGLATNWADKFKEAWRNADFTEIGTIVGTKLKNALDNIPWTDIQSTCNRIASSLATFINGFVATPGLWETVGSTVGNGINTAVGMWNTFFDTTNFVNIGTSIATALSTAFQIIDFYELGRALSQKIRAAIDLAYGFVTTFNWMEFGLQISNAINGFFDNIDFERAGETISVGITGALQTINTAISNFDWVGVGQKIGDFIEAIDWVGIFGGIGTFAIGIVEGLLSIVHTVDWASVGSGFLDGLLAIDWVTLLSELGMLIGDTICAALDFLFADGNGGKLLEIGANIVSGLLHGIVYALASIGTWIKENVFDPFITAFKNIFGIHSPSTVMAEQGGFLISGLLNGITSAWKGITSFFNGALSSLGKLLKGAWSGIKSVASTAWNGIKTTVTDKFSSAKTALSNTADNIKNNLSGSWDNLKKTASAGFEAVKSDITGKMKSAMDIIKNQGWSGVGKNICDGISSGINSGWNFLKGTVGKLASGLLSAAKNALGIHSPSRLFRDQVGEMIPAGISEGINDSEIWLLNTVRNMTDTIADGFSNVFSDLDFKIPVTTDSVFQNLKVPTPIVATGAVIPPKAIYSSSNQSDVQETLSGLKDLLERLSGVSGGKSGNPSFTNHTTVQISGKTIFDIVEREKELVISQTGYSH